MKRLLCLGLVIALVILLPMVAGAQQSNQEFMHKIGKDGNITITAYTGIEADVVIPAQIAGLPVTVIGEGAFGDNGHLVSISIPEGVFSIEKSAFQNCSSLESVNLPSSLSSIGESAFNSCTHLKQVIIPARISALADSTFFRCLELTDITLPAGLKSIGRMAIAVTGIAKIDLPISLESIGKQAFYGNRNLVSITLPNNIRRIDEFAFFVCENLKSVILPAGLASIDSGVFDKCPKLEMVAIPLSVRHIMSDALYTGLAKPEFAKIYGAKGSEAENFARLAGFPFEPIVTATSVQMIHNNLDAAGKKVAIDLSSASKSLQLNAVAIPETLWPGVTWNSSSPNIAVVDSYGLVTGLSKGEAIITAAAIDGSGAKVSLQLNVANLAKSITISGGSAVPSKGKITLKADVLPLSTDNKNVEWSVSDTNVASINANGVVTANEVTEKKQVTISAIAKDGSGIIGSHQLSVNPLVTNIALFYGGKALDNTTELDINLSLDQPTIQLAVEVLPNDAIQTVSWQSSSPKVAAVDNNGLVTALKKGKVLVSAVSIDGTKTTASCMINVANLAREIVITGENAVTSGQKITLKAVVLPETADNRKAVWTSSDESVAKVSKSGVVTARKVTEKKVITITATAQDNSKVTAIYQVTVHPEATAVRLFMDGQMLEAKAPLDIDLSSAEISIQLSANILPVDAAQNVIWKSSNPRVASVDENGLVTGLKKGQTTITATTVIGARRKASCLVTVLVPKK